MTDAKDLMEDHAIVKVPVPGNALRRMDVLYFRADKVIKLLQERNVHLQEISDRLAKAVENHKARKAELDAAYAELHKIWGGHNVLFDREVYNRVEVWWKEQQEDESCQSNGQG